MSYQETLLVYDEEQSLREVILQPHWMVEGTRTSVSNGGTSNNNATYNTRFITSMTGNFRITLPDLYPTHLIMPTTVSTGAFGSSFFFGMPMSPSGFENDRQTFLTMKGSLLQNAIYREKFVAILDGKIVDHGEDIGQVAKRVYKRFGYKPVYIDKVTAETETFENSSPE
jgi:hypothetical protein